MGLILTEVTGESAKDWVESWVEYFEFYLEQHDNDLFTDSLAWIFLGTAMGFSIMNWFFI